MNDTRKSSTSEFKLGKNDKKTRVNQEQWKKNDVFIYIS